MATGQFLTFRTGFESSFKTLPGTVNAVKIPIINPTVEASRNTFRSAALTGSAEPRVLQMGKLGSTLDFSVEVSGHSIIDLLKGVFGTTRRQGTAALYTDDFRLGTQLFMFTEEEHSDASAFFFSKGNLLTKFGLDVSAEGLCQATFGGLGATLAPAAATVVNGATTDRTTGAPLSFLYARIMVAGVLAGYVKRLSFNLDRQGESDMAIDQTDEKAEIFSQVAQITGSLEARLISSAFAIAIHGGAEMSISGYVPSAFNDGTALLFEMPTVRFQPAKRSIAGQGVVTLTGSFEAHARGTASDIAGYARGKYLTGTVAGMAAKTLVVKPDGGADQTVTFTAGATTPDAIVGEINTQTTGLTASVERNANDTGGVILLKSDTKGTASSITVNATSTGEVDLGFDTVIHSGLTNCALFVQCVHAEVAPIS